MRARSYGILLVSAASVCWSFGGLFVRGLDLDIWTMSAWRSLFASISLAAIMFFQHGRHAGEAVRGMGRTGLLAIPISAISMLCYVASMKMTTVANVMTVYATVPFVAAGVAYVWAGERAQRRVLLASGIAFVGIVIMAGSATHPQDIAGNTLALGMTMTFSVVLVMARRYPSISMALVNALAALVCAAVCMPFAHGGVPNLGQLVVLAGFGFTTTALAYLLFLTGGRHIPSSEAGLLSMFDVVLGPLWVWLAFSEQPTRAGSVGAVFVLAAVGWYLSAEWRQRSAPHGQPAE